MISLMIAQLIMIGTIIGFQRSINTTMKAQPEKYWQSKSDWLNKI